MLTAYCSIEDVPHIELNGHILVPLQNVASLHCSSRCDAPEPDWPPRGLDERRDEPTTATTTAVGPCARRRARNLLKAWLLVAACSRRVRRARLAARRAARARRCSPSARSSPRSRSTRSATARCSGCSARARSRSPRIRSLRSTVDRLAAQLGVAPPKLAVIDDGFPRAFVVGRGPGGVDARRSAPACSAPDARASSRPSIAHELAHVRSARRAHPDASRSCSPRRCSSSTPDRRLALARAPRRARRRSPPRSRTSCSRRGASSRPTGRGRRLPIPHDLADALLRLDRAGELVAFEALAGDRAALHGQPVRRTDGLAADVRHAPAGRRAGRGVVARF